MAAGMSEAPFVTPFEVIKVNMQAQSTLDCTPSAWEVAKQIVKTYGIGLSGLLRGLSATVLRGGTYSAVYYGFYFSSREMKKARDVIVICLFRFSTLWKIYLVYFYYLKRQIHACIVRSKISFSSCFLLAHFVSFLSKYLIYITYSISS